MAQEIGVAYVSLLPSGKGFSKAVQSESESAFKGAEKSSDSFFSKVVGWAKTGAVVVGGMVTAVGALALGGGISRALNIEDATAKLKGLGHDTQTVEAIMKDALASVKGTAFGLDAAATTAASAVAAGIKPGQELERYLKLTADAATIAGTSMDEMGSIINQVTSKGYAGMENLNRLTERGIPIMQWLQKEYGVTADELQKMVSRGEVDAETFRRAIENNIGGAALESGNTTRGAFSNMLASLSRLGEGFAGPALGAARDFFNEITKITDGIKTALAPSFEDLQSAVDGMDFTFSDNVLAQLNPILTTINDISAAARDGSLGEWLKDFASMSPALSVLVKTIGYLTPLFPVFKDFGQKVAPTLAEAFREIGRALLEMGPALIKELAEAIVDIVPPLADLLVALLPIIPPILELVQMLLPALKWLIEVLGPLIAGVADGFTEWFKTIQIFDEFINGSQSLAKLNRDILSIVGPIGEFTRAFVGLAEYLAVAMISIENQWNAGWSRIGSFFTSVGQAILNTGTYIWNLLPEGFRNSVGQVVGVLSTLPGTVQRIMAGVGSLLVGSGRALMQGFIDGINSMIGRVGSAVNSVLSWASGFFPHSPAKRGTFAGSGWTAVEDGGASLMEQFASGAESFRPEISFSNLSSLIGAGSSATTGAVPRTVTQNIYPQQTDPRIQMRQWGREAERAFTSQ